MHQLMENIIYFVVGFKSFDIEKISGTTGIWYEWTERSRKTITRTSFSKRSMEWIVQILREASKTQGNIVRRWKKTEALSEIFCARNYNKFGRYISLINLRGKRKSVLIIPEMTLNSGWVDIAEKLTRFISTHRMKNVTEEYRLTDSNIPYAKMVRSFKWANRDEKDSKVDFTVKNGEVISIKDSLITQNEVWKRSLVGEFNAFVVLSEVRRTGHGGDWHWLKTPIRLQWWDPLSGTIEKKNGPDTTWVKIVGAPTPPMDSQGLQINRIRGDGSNIPREIKIENGGLVFTMQIWVETSVKGEAGEDNQNRSFNQQILGDNPMGKRSNEATDIVQGDRARVESNPRPCAIASTSGVQQLLSLTNKAQIQSVEREILGPKESLGHNPTEVNLPPLILKGKSREAHEDSLSGLKNIKELASQIQSFSWFFTGVYGPHSRSEKLKCWEEMAAMKDLSEGPWVTSGDFNTVRHMEERRGCTRVTNIMTDFSKWIEDLELHDPELFGGKYTWFR
ncbi:hypothetical protein KY289_001269 [Solanum tuberosum]|nr:hypothetical protein KY289_001269 [Solanum tuberosum]